MVPAGAVHDSVKPVSVINVTAPLVGAAKPVSTVSVRAAPLAPAERRQVNCHEQQSTRNGNSTYRQALDKSDFCCYLPAVTAWSEYVYWVFAVRLVTATVSTPDAGAV